MNKRCFILLIVFICGSLFVYCLPVHAQEENSDSEIVAEEKQNAQEMLEVPKVTLPSFSYSETKEGAVKRGFVISLGLFPFSYFYTNFAFDLARFISHDFDTAYAPWPFNTQYSAALTNSEVWTRIGIASGASILLGFLSVIIE